MIHNRNIIVYYNLLAIKRSAALGSHWLISESGLSVDIQSIAMK